MKEKKGKKLIYRSLNNTSKMMVNRMINNKGRKDSKSNNNSMNNRKNKYRSKNCK